MPSPDLDRIARQLESRESRDRLLALTALRDVPPEDAVPLIEKVLDDENLQVRSMAVFALGIKPTAKCYDLLVDLLNDGDYSIRANAAGALGYLEDERAFAPLVRAFYEDTDWLVRFSAAVSLGNLKDARARQVLVEALDSEETILHQAALAALGEVGATDAVDRMLDFVKAEDWLVRQRLAEALGNLPGEKSLAALKFLEKDAHSQVAQAARLSRERLETDGDRAAAQNPQ